MRQPWFLVFGALGLGIFSLTAFLCTGVRRCVRGACGWANAGQTDAAHRRRQCRRDADSARRVARAQRVARHRHPAAVLSRWTRDLVRVAPLPPGWRPRCRYARRISRNGTCDCAVHRYGSAPPAGCAPPRRTTRGDRIHRAPAAPVGRSCARTREPARASAQLSGRRGGARIAAHRQWAQGGV